MLSLELVPLTQSLWPTPTGAAASPPPRPSTSCSGRFPVQQAGSKELGKFYSYLNIVSPGPRLTVSSISLASQDLSRATTLPGASFSSLRSTTTASGQRRATAPSSGRSPPPPPRTPSVSGPHPQLRLSPMDVTPLPTRASSSFLTWVRMESRSFPFLSVPHMPSSPKCVGQTLESREWEPLPSH